MSKERATIGADGHALPILPPERDARVWARLVRVMFYTPGFMGLLLIKTGEPASFGITVELLMLAAAAAIVGGLFIGLAGVYVGDFFAFMIPDQPKLGRYGEIFTGVFRLGTGFWLMYLTYAVVLNFVLNYGLPL